MVRQFRGFAHVIDRLADVPVWRHRDEFGLHSPAGGILRIFEGAGDRNALGRRDLIEDLGLFFLRKVLENGYRIIGLDLADALRHRLRRQLFEDLLADRIVDFCKSCEIEVDAQQFDQPWPLLGFEGLDERAHVGLMQTTHQLTQLGRVAGFDPARDALYEGLADGAVLVARQLRSFGLSFIFLIEHVGAWHRNRARRLYARIHAGANLKAEASRSRQACRQSSVAVNCRPGSIMTRIVLLAIATAVTPLVAVAAGCPGNPQALGTERVLEVDFKSTPRVGRKQFACRSARKSLC